MAMIVCGSCHKETKAKDTPRAVPRLPPSWKRKDGLVYCPACWHSLYMLRAITFPVDGVNNGDWSDFTAAVRAVWRETTWLSNWAVNRLISLDPARAPGQEKLHPLPAVNLYRDFQSYAGRDQWTGSAQSAAAILRHVEACYREKRYQTIWLSAAAHATHRYPTPFPSHNASWTASWHEATDAAGEHRRCPLVNVALHGRRWDLRLRGGATMRRQLGNFAHLVDGSAVQGELALYGKRSAGTHGPTTQTRRPGGGNRQPLRIMCKLVAWVPRPANPRVGAGTLLVRTSKHALLVATAPGRAEPWIMKQRQVVHWIRHHAKRLEDLAEDSKAEGRKPRRQRVGMLDRYATLTHRFRQRLNTFVDTCAAWLVQFAVRQNVAAISYNDADTRYFKGQGFPWARLREGIKRRAEDAGLAWIVPAAAAATEAAAEDVVPEA